MVKETYASRNLDDLGDIGAWATVEIDKDLNLGLVCLPGDSSPPGHDGVEKEKLG